MKDRTLLADLPLAAAAAVLGAVALGASLTGAGRASAGLDTRAGGDAVARVTDLVADPRLRPVGTLVWRDLAVGTKLVRHDAVYVPEGAEVSLAFDDGTRLAIAERSLVIIDRDVTRGASLELVSGAVRGAAGTGALSVRAADAHATVAPGGELSVARLAAGGSARVTVHAGDAHLKAGGEDVRMAGGEARDVDAKGKLGAAETLSVALAAPAAGERVAPGEADGASVRFEWRAPSAAAGALRLEVAREADFVALVYGAVTASPATVTGLAPGVYHWRVRAEGGADRSEERTFVVSALRAPVPVQPRAGEVVYLPGGALYTLAWSPVPGATRYRVEVAAERRFDHADIDRLVTAPRLVLEGGLGESMYAWRVRAIGPDGAESVPSRAVPFRLIVKPIPAAPRLLDPELRLYDEEGAAPFPAPRTGPSPAPSPTPASPAKPPPPAAPPPPPAPHGEEGGLLWRLIGGVAWADEPVAADKDVGAAIVLRWTPVPGIKRYRLQIAEDDKFAKLIVDATVDGAFYEWHKIAKRDYWWRVQSIDAEGRPGEFSPAKRVGAVLSAPALEAPAAGAAFATGAAPLTVTLRWAKAALARGYEVEIGGVTLAAKDASLAYRPAAPGEFTWRVRAVDAAGGKTPFGESRAFRVVLGAPAASPVAVPAKPFAAGAAPLSLRWSEVEGAAEYEVEVSPSKKFAPVAASAKTAAHAFGWTPPSAGNFYWRVRSLAPGVASSEWSKAAALALPLAPPSVKAPAAGATLRFRGAAGFDVAWSDVPGATSYEVVIVAALAAAGAPAAVRLGADHSPAHVAGLDAGSYTLRVRALGAGGAAADSTDQPLVLAALDALPAPATLAPAPGGSVTYRGTPPPLRLAWSAVPDAASYEVAVESGATAGGGASAPAPRTAKSAATETSLPAPAAPGRYQWRVRAVDRAGTAGAWSAPASFYFGPPTTAGADVGAGAVVADGHSRATVRVALRDAAGAPVAGARLRLEAHPGRLDGAPREIRPGVYEVSYVAPDAVPPGGAAVVTVEDPDSGFRAEGRIAVLPRTAPLSLGLAAGVVFNLGPVLAPRALAVALWHTPLAGGRIGVFFRGGWHGATLTLGTAPEQRAWMHVVALELGVRAELRLGRATPYLGAAAALGVLYGRLTAPTQETVARLSLSPGVTGLAGVDLRVGPGAVFLEAGYRWLRARNDLFDFDGGGLEADLGYRVSL